LSLEPSLSVRLLYVKVVMRLSKFGKMIIIEDVAKYYMHKLFVSKM